MAPREGAETPGRQGLDPLVWLIPLVFASLAAIIVSAVLRRDAAARSAQAATASAATTAQVVAAVTTVPAGAWNAVAAASAIPPILIPVAQRSANAPTVLYIGAEWCPFCAAERWPLAAALARFGTLSGLTLTTSSSTDQYPNTPTLSFAESLFSGPGIDVQTVEVQDRERRPLQSLTAAQSTLLQRYDAPPYVPAKDRGGIPFLLIGGRYLWPGSQFSPQALRGLDWTEVSSGLASAQTQLSRVILANGNEIAAAICAVDGGSPAAVCGSSGVRAAAALLPAS